MSSDPLFTPPSAADTLQRESGHDELHIDKERISVVLRLRGGLSLEGVLFLFPEPVDGAPLWRRVLGFLNQCDHFFPLRTVDDRTILVSRDQLIEASIVHASPDSLGDEDEAHFTTGRARALLADGSTVEGCVVIESDAEHDRLSDFVAQPEPFLHIAAACDTIVHKSAIRVLEPLD